MVRSTWPHHPGIHVSLALPINMFRHLAIVVAALSLVGCSVKSTSPNAAPTNEQSIFGGKWKAASQEQRRTMADVAKAYQLFQGATKSQVIKALGQATESGIDKYGEDVICYRLGDVPDGGGEYHLTFVFENGAVIRVTGNSMRFSP